MVAIIPDMGPPYNLMDHKFEQYYKYILENSNDLFIDPERLGVYSLGHGSPPVIDFLIKHFDNKNSTIKAVVFESAFFPYFYDEPQNQWAAAVLFQQGEYENFDEVKEYGPLFAEKIEALGTPVSYEIVEGGSHYWPVDHSPVDLKDLDNSKKALSDMMDFLFDNLTKK